MSNLIGLTGLATSGKDAVGALLKMVGYMRFAFADEVRREVEESFENNASIPLMPDHIFADWLMCAGEPDGVLWQKPLLPQARRVLQWHGTEYRRAQNTDYWIDKLGEALEDYDLRTQGLGKVVISDVRFLNEASTLVKYLHGVIWRVERPGCKSDGHVSETELLDIPVDYVVYNNGDLQHLATQVLKGLAFAKTSTK